MRISPLTALLVALISNLFFASAAPLPCRDGLCIAAPPNPKLLLIARSPIGPMPGGAGFLASAGSKLASMRTGLSAFGSKAAALIKKPPAAAHPGSYAATAERAAQSSARVPSVKMGADGVPPRAPGEMSPTGQALMDMTTIAVSAPSFGIPLLTGGHAPMQGGGH